MCPSLYYSPGPQGPKTARGDVLGRKKLDSVRCLRSSLRRCAVSRRPAPGAPLRSVPAPATGLGLVRVADPGADAACASPLGSAGIQPTPPASDGQVSPPPQSSHLEKGVIRAPAR